MIRGCRIWLDRISTSYGTQPPIGQAARSGNLEWDSLMGHAHYTVEAGGYPGLRPKMLRVEEGKTVLVTIPE